eukprot:3836168-Pyramimonas_sp.AAC.1
MESEEAGMVVPRANGNASAAHARIIPTTSGCIHCGVASDAQRTLGEPELEALEDEPSLAV